MRSAEKKFAQLMQFLPVDKSTPQGYQMPRLPHFICALLFMLTAQPALSSDTFSVPGAGGVSCGKVLDAKGDRNARLQFEQWVEGYLTGYNYYTHTRNITPPDSASVFAYVENYCRNNPLHALVSAAAALVQELGGRIAAHQFKR